MSSQLARSCQQTLELRQLNAAAEAEATETLLLELLLRKMLLSLLSLSLLDAGGECAPWQRP